MIGRKCNVALLLCVSACFTHHTFTLIKDDYDTKFNINTSRCNIVHQSCALLIVI